MLYVEPIYRPPSEAGSLLVQATIGCASAAQGHCYFCGSWLIDRQIPQKKFRVRPAREVMKDLDEARDALARARADQKTQQARQAQVDLPGHLEEHAEPCGCPRSHAQQVHDRGGGSTICPG